VIDGGIKVYIVDGDKVKLIHDADYVEGGSGERFPFIPKNEIWLDDRIVITDLQYILIHEATERRLMANEGLDYYAAHERANGVELFHRRRWLEEHQPLLERSSTMVDGKSLLIPSKCPACGGTTKSDGTYTWCITSPCDWWQTRPPVLERSSIESPTPNLSGQASTILPEMKKMPAGQRIGKHAAARTLGHYGGKHGGPARDRKLSKKEKKAIARMGARARWKRKMLDQDAGNVEQK
jgi:hypothetical protein